jgi:hypothetical protein
MYDSGEHTVEEIAATFNVARTTLHGQLNAYGTGADCALIVYRNSKPKIDKNNHRYGETGAREGTQLDADRKWWNVAPAGRPRLKAIVYVVDGTVIRVRAVHPDGKWGEHDRRYADVPVSGQLTDTEIATQLPTLNLHLGDPRPPARQAPRIRHVVKTGDHVEGSATAPAKSAAWVSCPSSRPSRTLGAARMAS